MFKEIILFIMLLTIILLCQVDKLEFEQNKLKDQSNNQKQELEFQIKTKLEEIEMIKVSQFTNSFYSHSISSTEEN